MQQATKEQLKPEFEAYANERCYCVKIWYGTKQGASIYCFDSQLASILDEYESKDVVTKIQHDECNVPATFLTPEVVKAQLVERDANANKITHAASRPQTSIFPTGEELFAATKTQPELVAAMEKFGAQTLQRNYFSKPYDITQVNVLDKVQVANMAIAMLADPAWDIYPIVAECTLEQLTAKTEAARVQFDLLLEELKYQRGKAGLLAVDKIRGEGEVVKKAKREKVAKTITTAKTSKEKTEATKAINGIALSGEHKRLLKIVQTFNLSIPNLVEMNEKQLTSAIQVALSA